MSAGLLARLESRLQSAAVADPGAEASVAGAWARSAAVESSS